MSVKKVRVLGVIPARGGSKRLPGKNIKELNGKPLVSYTIESAIHSGIFTEIWLSSDDDNILDVAKYYPEITPKKRESKYAQDTTKVLELMNNIASDKALQEKFDVIALLLPTCPFRRSSDLVSGLNMLTTDADSVVSFTDFEFPHAMSVNIDEVNKVISPVFSPSPLITGNTRSQDHPPVFRPNGAFYMAWWGKFMVNQNYFQGQVKGYTMDRRYSADIDTETDFEYAEFMLQKGRVELDFLK